MPITAAQLKASGRLVNKDVRSHGVWEIEPPLKVVATDNSEGDDQIKVGRIYEACKWDEDGKYAGFLHLHPTATHWRDMLMFDLVPE